jgi:hypothetical protein
LNIIKHSHRNKKALYLMSTDIRKAVDTVSHSSFLQSLEIIGYGQNCIDLMSNLQSDFKCSVRTPHGLSEKNDIQQGCKQGCVLSPIGFILVYDIFLKYLEDKRYGYDWNTYTALTPEQEILLPNKDGPVIIPGFAFMEDMVTISDTPGDMVEMIGHFDKFLTAVGLSIQATKCHNSAINVREDSPPRPIQVTNHLGQMIEIPILAPDVPLEYMGYLIRLDDTNPTKEWALHNYKIRTKVLNAAQSLRKSRLRGPEAADLMNTDIISVMTYFSAPNVMPRNIQAKQKNHDVNSEPGTRFSPSPCIKDLRKFIFQAGYIKLKFLPITPRATVVNTSSGVGYGITNPEAFYGTAKINNVLASL